MISLNNITLFAKYTLLLFLSISLNSGCVLTGDTIAFGDGAIARGGDSRVDVSLQLNIDVSLSEGVTKAATDAAKRYLSGLSGLVTEKEKHTAVDQGVKAGLEKAKEEGSTLNKKEEKVLKAKVEKVVHDRT